MLFDELRLGEGHEATLRLKRKATASKRQVLASVS